VRASTAAACARAVLLVVALSAGLSGTALRPQPQAPRTPFDIVFDRYLHGDADAAVEEFARWPAARLPADVPAIGTQDDPGKMVALAMLFTEAGIQNGRFLRNPPEMPLLSTAKGEWRPLPWPPGKGSDQEEFFLGRQNDLRRRLLSVDGFDVYSREASWLIRRAATLAKEQKDTRVAGVCHSWYILALGLSLQPANWEAQGPVIRAALVDFGDDPQVLMAVASAMDSGMSQLVKLQDGSERSRPRFSFAQIPAAKKTKHRTFTDVQLRAVPTLRRALELDPGLVEARLRLGRLLYQLEGPAEAQTELVRALRESREVGHVFAWYLGGLFLGELHEDAGRVDEAVAAYREAVAAIPAVLSARMALTHVLLANDRTDEGWAAARGSFDNSKANRLADTDPWHLYSRGQAWQAASRLRAMREAVRQ
jgi:tetratricopeptide (TPR) repeat protein